MVKIGQRLPAHDDRLFWSLTDPMGMPGDARCEFVYQPTYLVAQILVNAVVRYPNLLETQGLRKLLHQTLNACTARGLIGHGYDGVAVMYENVRMFLEAGWRWFRYTEVSPDFHDLFKKCTEQLERDYSTGHHEFGWGEDLKAKQEEIIKLMATIPCPIARDERYYIAYGSNMSIPRMLKRCP